jgi:hypothetical protein
VLVITHTLGPNTFDNTGYDNPRTNLITKSTLAPSASNDERNDPSPSLFNADRLGNSHSTSGYDDNRGLDKAARIDVMAVASRSDGDDGILASLAAPSGGRGRAEDDPPRDNDDDEDDGPRRWT